MANNTLKSRIDPLLISLEQDQEIIQKTSRAIEIAKIILEEIGVLGIESPDEILYRILKLPNADRYDSWFAPHPYYASERACFAITDDTTDTLEAKLYILKKKSRSMIAGAVNFTPNWEDFDHTRDDSTTRVGIDFFLTPTNSLIVALSNRGKLRIMELSDHMSNTQVEIFATWRGVYNLSTREAIHATLWEALKLESVNNKFFLGVAQSFTDLIQHLEKSGRHHEESKLFASRLHGRLLFVWFLRKKHIISERFDYFTTTDLSATEYYIKRLSPLFFECLNTPITERNTLDRDTPYLNGGLFDPKTDGYEWVASTLTFPEGFFDRLYTHFDQFNFTTDESTPDYEQIAIDPEMLGRIFENLLATQVEATGEQARKAKGAFYTPREIVSYMCRESLRQYLYTRFAKHESIDRLLDTSVSDWAKAGTNSRRDNYTPEEQRSIIGALDDITILDPACGSGAYPMGILQMMLHCYERLDTRYDPYQAKLQIIRNNLYGVDIEPMAVEIARLRAWLSLIVDEPSDSKNVKPLPNLDFKFVCANTLIPLASESGIFDKPGLKDEMKTLRDDYYSTTSRSKKESLKAKFEKLLDLGKGDGLFGSKQEQQLKSYHPFNVVSSCGFFDPEFMFGIEDGFDMVIGNPPYGAKLTTENKDYFKKLYSDVHMRTPDTFNYFISLSFRLLKKDGISCYIVPNNLLFQTEYEKTRLFLIKTNAVKVVMNLGDGIFESATVPSCVFLCQKLGEDLSLNREFIYADMRNAEKGSNIDFRKYFEVKNTQRHLEVPSLVFGVSNVNLDLIQKLEKQSISIDMIAEEMASGISTGGDKIFRLSESRCKELNLENAILRKVLVGGEIHRFTINNTRHFLIYTNRETPIGKFENIKSYLSIYEEKLNQRSESKAGILPWFALGRQRYPELFTEEKIILRQTADKIIATYDNDGYFVLNSILILKLKKESIFSYKFILGILNSSVSQFLYSNFTQEEGRTFAEVKPKNVRKLYIPNIGKYEDQQSIILLVEQILEIKKQDPKAHTTELEGEIDRLVYGLYELTPEEIAVIEESVK